MEGGFNNREIGVRDVLQNEHVIEDLKNKAEAKKRRYQSKAEDFIGLPGYKESEIQEELESIKNYKKNWLDEETPELRHQKNIAEVVEHVVVDQFSGEWLANKATGHYTAEADDVLRGVDVVAELNSEDEGSERKYLGFALDVTMAKDTSVIDQKLSRIWEKDIKPNKPAKVKYLETDHYKGSVELFRVIVGVNKDFARELINLQRFGKKEALASHPFQAHLIVQIKFQLESYYKYAEITGNQRFKDQVTESLRVFYEIYDAKESLIEEKQKEIEAEPDFIRIKNFCEQQLASAERFFQN
jgi:hypothetical protein